MSESCWKKCANPRCRCQVPPGHVMCAGCWEKVPLKTQELVAATWCPDFMTSSHRHALDAAVRCLKGE